MKKSLLLTLGLVWSISSFATTIHPTETWPSSRELAEIGINVEFRFGPVCGDATQIIFTVPNDHYGNFSGATLELEEEGELFFYANVRHAEPQEAVDSPENSSELFICLHPTFYKLAVLRLHYAKGQHTTHTIVFRVDSVKSQ